MHNTYATRMIYMYSLMVFIEINQEKGNRYVKRIKRCKNRVYQSIPIVSIERKQKIEIVFYYYLNVRFDIIE
jgi:hypothetical protein